MIEHVVTKDGSSTLYAPHFDEHYHSVHGAITESLHVFIQAGLTHWQQLHPEKEAVRVFEMGFGTGLNALLTAVHADKARQYYYESVEAYPLADEMWRAVNYAAQFQAEEQYQALMEANWGVEMDIKAGFAVKKCHTSLQDWLSLAPKEYFDVVYFDAFAPSAQPELWTAEVFEGLKNAMIEGAILTTYCAKGDVRRALQSVGFVVERLPGPPMKREMLRAKKA